MTKPSTQHLPAPLDADDYVLLRQGVFDDPDIRVYVNVARDFAFLDPKPQVDYTRYVPRVQSLNLGQYKKTSNVFANRLAKVAPLLAGSRSFLEVGSADATFLQLLHSEFPKIVCAAIEPDQNTRSARDALPWLTQFPSPAEARGFHADFVALFHVFEHLEEPDRMLAEIKPILSGSGRLLIEVPSLSDPLLSLYSSPEYEAFYFQRQHPFVYTAASIARVLERSGFVMERAIPYQRYGLENHLQWLTAKAPGGNARFRDLFAPIADAYKQTLEAEGATDSVFVVARASA